MKSGGPGVRSESEGDDTDQEWNGDSPVSPLRIRWFRALWLANGISQTFWFVHQVATAWLMLELTGSPLWVGLAIASATLPILVLGLLAGTVADLMDRRRVLIGTQATMGLASVSMAVLWNLEVLTPILLLALGLVIGVALAFDRPAWQALLPDLVPHRLVASAVALNSASNNAAKVLGPALGGVIMATAGAGIAFVLNGLSYVAVIVVIARFRSADWQPEDETSITGAIGAGLRYARFSLHFRWLLLTVSLFAFSSAALAALLPNITRDSLEGTSILYGSLLGMEGLGAITGAVFRRRVSKSLRGLMVPIAMTCFAVGTLFVAIAREPVVASAGAFIAGVGWLWTLTTLHATYLILAPAWVRGRMMSLYLIAFLGSLPLGSIASGALADLVGVNHALATMGAATGAVALLSARLPIPILADVATPEPALEEPEDSHSRAAARVTGGPVLVENTWIIQEEELDAFLAAMVELRLVRLRTGAFRWSLYRAAADPRQITEAMLLNSWDDHLRQHERIDSKAAETIARARMFDHKGGPFSRHLIAVDPSSTGRPDWKELIIDHNLLHEIDGSIPLQERAPTD